ncbi:MAG TPA: hypothetical protein PLX10_01695, partial [Candidatus Paceibacterota bacterium]|nr:hypothetical protein [Candidatus Paceibacterota bacterium]
MKRFSKIFCVALVAIIFFGVGYSVHAETCIPANPAVSVTAQSIPATCTVKSCPKYCYTSEFIKQIFEDLDKDATLTSYAKNTLQIDGKPHYDWSFDNATIPDLNGIIGSYINQVQESCKKNDGTTPTDTATYNACVTAYQDLLSSWSSLQGNPLRQDATFNSSKIVKQLKNDVDAIVKNNFTNLTPTNPINNDNRPTAAATTQSDNSECADITPGFFSCIWDLPLCFLKYANIGIIHMTAWIIKVGVNTMGWLMQPHNLWGGISNNPAVIQAFGASVSVVNIVFSVVLIMMAIGTILNLKNYRINDLITKFIVVALLINFTLVVAGSVLDLANYISLYFFNATLKSVQSGDVASKWIEILTNNVCLSGWASSVGRMLSSIVINLLALIAITWALFSMCGSLLKRGLMLIFLLILSPFAVICYLLPVKGMGQWWDKWKKEFLKQAFYGVYISVGFYLGTIMLSALAINPTQSTDPDLSFVSGLIKPILAAGYLIYIVLLADEVAGGSAKAAAEGVAKLALGAAAGGAAAIAMKAKTAITTSEDYGKRMGSLSTKKGLGWLGNAGLKARENDLAYIDKQGAAVDEAVNRRDVDTNKARLESIAKSTDPKLVREKIAIAKQLIAQKKMDKDSAKLLEDNADTIANDKNRRTGWVPPALKKSLKDSMPSLFIRNDVEKDTGTSEADVVNAMNQHLDANGNVDIDATAQALVNAKPDLQLKQGDVAKALRKYLDDRAKIGIQFAKNAANANEEALVESIIDNNRAVQGEIMKRLAENPATMRSVMDQISESGLSREKKEQVTRLFQSYIDEHGSGYTEKQFNYIDENISRLNTDNARARKAGKTPINEALETAFEENTVKDEEIKIEHAISRQKQMKEDQIKTIQDIKKSQEITRNRKNLEEEIEKARLERFTASDEQSA